MKLRLQFTGWLQYLIPAVPALVSSLLAGPALLLAGVPAAIVFASIGALLLATDLFDLVTVKLKLRPPERRPAQRTATASESGVEGIGP